MKKKVLFLIPNLAHGGAERVLVNLVNNIDPERFEVTIQTLFDVGVNRKYLKPHIKYIPGLKKQFRGNSYLIKLFSSHFLYKHIVQCTYDVVISYLEGPTARIVAGCSDKSTKKICWLHSGFETISQAARCFNSVKEACAAYNSYDRIIAVSRGVKEKISGLLDITAEISVLYNTNETEHIQAEAKKLVRDFTFDGAIPCVCSIGKLIEVKRFDRILNAHKRLLDEGLIHKVIILGTGEQQKKLTQAIIKQGLNDTFILVGYRENPYQYLARCDLYVCSSQREGLSTAVTEALVLGIPVLSTDCSGARELLGDHDEYGLVVENSEEGIYQGMRKMLSDPALLAHYREKAKERGKSFSREQTVKAVEDMLDRL